MNYPPEAKVWALMGTWYVTFGPFDSEAQADKFSIPFVVPQKKTKLSLQAPRDKGQLCACGVPIRTHRKPTLVLHLSNLCKELENQPIL